jgi:hypothetical protein
VALDCVGPEWDDERAHPRHTRDGDVVKRDRYLEDGPWPRSGDIDEKAIVAVFRGITSREATRADIAEVGRELRRDEDDVRGG